MRAQSEIFLMTRDGATAELVKSALEKSQGTTLAGICGEPAQLRARLATATPQAIVVDVDPDPARILHDLGTVIAMYPETRAVAVSEKYDNELILRAMQVGVRNFLQKESITCELAGVLDQLILGSAEHRVRSGSVITVFSASGGCGATTVALNLANELRLASSGQVLTIDMDSSYGTVSTYLGIDAKYGIADVLAHKGQIDKHLVMSSACMPMKDFHVLISPAGLGSPMVEPPQHENIIDVLGSCRQVYEYTVIDAPRVGKTVFKELAGASDMVLVVFQPTVKDVKFTRSLVMALADFRVGAEKITLLANRFKRRNSAISLADSRKVLGVNSLHRIRSDWNKAMNCVNRGRLLAEVAPRSGLRRDFRKLAAKISACVSNGNGKG